MEQSSGEVRHNAKCGACMEVIYGTRYKCSCCPNWDYCSQCYANVTENHPMHPFNAYEMIVDNRPVLKTQLLPVGSTVAVGEDMSRAEIVRRITTVSGDPIFVYTPLTAPRSFRLVAVLPGNGGTRIRCKIAHVNLDEELHFEALSYSWGDPHSMEIILVDELYFFITENLHHALCQLRHETKVRYMWIDALCIDQIDVEEKNVQVRLMRAIYSKAREVIFWLGQEADNSDHAMDLMCGAAETSDSTTALRKLFERSCWRRVWCLQELSVPRSQPIVVCGTKPVKWDMLQAFCDTIVGPRPALYPGRDSRERQMALLDSANYANTRRVLQQGWSPLNLVLLLKLSNRLQATDLKDRIYGLVGIAADASDFIVDYSQNARQVFITAAQHIIKKSGRLETLGYNTGSSNLHFKQSLPSWVPDWSVPHRGQFYQEVQLELFRASGRHRPSFNFDGDNFNTNGFLADRIDQVSEPIWLKDDLSNLISTIDDLAMMLITGVKDRMCRLGWTMRKALEISPEPRVSDAFWRTLICDQVHNPGWNIEDTFPIDRMVRAPEECANMFEILWLGHNRQTLPNPESILHFDTHTQRLKGPPSCVPDGFKPELSLEERIEHYISPLKLALFTMSGKQFFVTESCRIGLAQQGIRVDDKVGILYGSTMPFILRGDESDESIQLISDAFVYGIMDGELVIDDDVHASYPKCQFKIR